MSTAYRLMSFLLLISVAWLNVSAAATPVFGKGVSMTINASVSNPNYVTGLKLDNLVVLTDTNKNEYPVAYVNLPNSQEFYLLRSGVSIYELNLSQKMHLGGWSLNGSYNQLVTLVGEESIAYEFLSGKIGNLIGATSGLQVGDLGALQMQDQYNKVLGCLQRYPLRYGDINGDGKPELVMDIANDWLVFSPSSHKTIFAARLGIDDSLSEAQVKWLEWTHDAPGAPQYVAQSGTSVDVDQVLPARRSYAKLYFGDFDGDGKPDILMWRKAYESRLNSDTVKGYKLIGEALVQYELDNGIYVKKDTDSATVKGWLAAKNLTWQQGYPNVSECPGEEGKPIPETVDPLLNDPDVLQ